MRRTAALAWAIGAWLMGCAEPPRVEREPNPLERPPVDSARVGSVEQIAAWAYRREVTADLDGDGTPERVAILSDVTLGENGSPLWEDGHRWAVVAWPVSGAPTLLYSAFVPRGFAEAAVSQPDDRGRRRVLIQERTPDQMRAMEVAYEGTGQARLVSGAYYTIERWLPGAAAMP